MHPQNGRCVQAGLSTIVEGVLGKPLDKMMQLSDWERRPLSAHQIQCEHNPLIDVLLRPLDFNLVVNCRTNQ